MISRFCLIIFSLLFRRFLGFGFYKRLEVLARIAMGDRYLKLGFGL